MRRTAVPIILLLLLSGCAGPPPVELPDGVTVVVQQNRSDIPRGLMQIRVENGSDAALSITRASLADERLAEAPAWEGTSEIPPGGIRDLPVKLPEATCTDAAGAASVDLVFAVEGRAGEAAVQPEDPFDLLATLSDEACTMERVSRSATFEWLPLERDGDAAVLRLAVVARDELVITSIDRTILLQPTDGSSLWALDQRIEAGGRADAVLTAEPARCDPHAIAEDKVGTRFRVTLELEGEPLSVTIPAPSALRSAIYGYLGEVCGA